MSDDPKNLRDTKTAVGEGKAQPSQRRRRLVKGALSAPVFLTLQNGSVFANTSNDATVVEFEEHVDQATVYEYGGEKRILCVQANPGPAVQETGASTSARYDFGDTPACLHMSVEELDENGMPNGIVTLESKQLAFRKCKEPNVGGYIIAGSSHASIC